VPVASPTNVVELKENLVPDEQREQEERWTGDWRNRCENCAVHRREHGRAGCGTFVEPDPERLVQLFASEQDELRERASLLAARVEELERELSDQPFVWKPRALRAEARLERCQEALRELRNRIKGIAGTLDTLTGYSGRSEREQLLELARRCRETAKELRLLSTESNQSAPSSSEDE
jgi:sugar-specific transcriptional regulator TrmB